MRAQQKQSSARGVTLLELLVVVAIIALAVTVSIPLISKTIRSARVRAAANQFSVTVKAVRMIAVTKQTSVNLDVKKKPDNFYEYLDVEGKTRLYRLHPDVCIVDTSDPIVFMANGSLAGGGESVTIFETRLTHDKVETWEVRTNLLGISSVTHAISTSTVDRCA